jgi:hypothetical protein
VGERNVPLSFSGKLDNDYNALLPEQKRSYVFFQEICFHKQLLQETIPLDSSTAYFYSFMFSILV